MVITDGAVLNLLCPVFPDLGRLWACGAKFRPHQISRNSADHVTSVRELLIKVLESLCRNVARPFNVAPGVFLPFREAILARIGQTIEVLPLCSLVPTMHPRSVSQLVAP